MSRLPASLASITFRKLKVEEVIALARRCYLDAIEWGGDKHVVAGDQAFALKVRQLTLQAGLKIGPYGSYDRIDGDFSPVLETAVALGATMVRIWAGERSSAKMTTAQRKSLVARLRERCAQAAVRGVEIGLEYHENTLTDTLDSALQLAREVDHPSLRLNWQPRAKTAFAENLRQLQALLPLLAQVHLFHWGPLGYRDRLSLEDGRQDWRRYLAEIARYQERKPRKQVPAITFEFVRGDEPDALVEDAATLRKILCELPARSS